MIDLPPRIAQYDACYRNRDPSKTRPEHFCIEEKFDAFVKTAGGRKIEEILKNRHQLPLNADYFFCEDNVIIELKTFEGIFSGQEGHRSFLQAFIDAGYGGGSEIIGVLCRGEPIPPRVQSLIRKRFRRGVEERIKKARKQLRQSKITLGDGVTCCLLLVAVDQPPIFGHVSLIHTVTKLMVDNFSDEHIDGFVYINSNSPAKPEAAFMEYSGWYPMYRDNYRSDRVVSFVNTLGAGWLDYLRGLHGLDAPILEIESGEEFRAVLGF